MGGFNPTFTRHSCYPLIYILRNAHLFLYPYSLLRAFWVLGAWLESG